MNPSDLMLKIVDVACRIVDSDPDQDCAPIFEDLETAVAAWRKYLRKTSNPSQPGWARFIAAGEIAAGKAI